MEIISTLGIEWQQLLAQIVNFAIIASVLTFFVYKPILKLLDERRETIRVSMDQADRIAHQAKEADAARQEKLRALDKEISTMEEKMKKEVAAKRDDLLASASREAEQIKERGHREVAQERDKLHAELRSRAAQLVISLAEKVLQREFTDKDQTRLLESLEKDVATSLKA